MNRVTFRRIVCGIADPDRAIDVMAPAMELAQLHGAHVRVLHVTERPYAPAGSVQRTMPDALLHARAAVAGRDTGRLHWTAMHGSAATQLARRAAADAADLVVVGRGRDRDAGLSLAARVLRASTCPVLVAARHADSIRAPFEQVLCCVASGLSHATLRYALSLTQEYEGQLTIVNVHEGPDAADAPLRSDLEHLRASFGDYDDAWCRIHEVAAAGDPARTLIELAHAQHPQLVVVGIPITTSGDGEPGAVARAAVRRTDAHVLLVPPPADLRAIAAAWRSTHAHAFA